MNVQEAIAKLNHLVKRTTGQELESLDKAIIQEILNDKPYDQMNISGYSLEYIKKNAAPSLFQRLTKILNLNQKLSKKTLKLVVEEMLAESSQSFNSSDTEEQSIWNIEPDIMSFYGREKEITELEQLISHDQCKLLAIIGHPGIGKTSLLYNLLNQIKNKFAYVKAINLQNAPLLNNVLDEILQGFSSDEQLLFTGEDKISKMIKLLQKHRFLLVFDQLEEIITTGKFKEGYEDYGKFFKQISEQKHQGCLILTSFESLPNFNFMLSSNPQKIYEYQLRGLDLESARKILADCHINGQQNYAQLLIGKYQGHPLILKMAAIAIKECHNGNIDDFLQGTLFIPADYIGGFLDKQFSYLYEWEKNVMRAIASSEPISMTQIFTEFSHISQSHLRDSIQKLLHRCLIEKDANNNFTISNAIVKKYVMKYLVYEG